MAQPHNKKLGEYPMTTRGREQGPEKRYRRLRFPAFTAAKWTTANPLLQRGELGVETDTRKIKVGDGITYWNDLEYAKAYSDWGNIAGDITEQTDLVDFVNAAVAAEANIRSQADQQLQANIDNVAADLSTHEQDTNNPHNVSKAQVGLGNVDNTSDADKPVSTAQATAINDAVSTHNASETAHSNQFSQYRTSANQDTIDNQIKSDIANLQSTKADKATTLAGYGITDAYTKTEVDAKVSSVYRFRGSVATYANLPTTGQVVGDVWNVEDTGANYAWSGSEWDKLSETVDLTPYLTKEDAASTYATITTVNGKQDALTAEQLAAVNSGITTAKVASYDAYAGEISAAKTTADKADNAAEVAQQTANLAGQEAAQALSGLAGKVNVAQGTANAGKVLGVGDDGNVAPVDGASGAGRNIGDIFWTTRTDSALAGAVEANGAQYNFADVNGGDNNVRTLLATGALPSVSKEEFDFRVQTTGGCDAWTYNSFMYAYTVPELPVSCCVYSRRPQVGDPVFCMINSVPHEEEVEYVRTGIVTQVNGQDDFVVSVAPAPHYYGTEEYSCTGRPYTAWPGGIQESEFYNVNMYAWLVKAGDGDFIAYTNKYPVAVNDIVYTGWGTYVVDSVSGDTMNFSGDGYSASATREPNNDTYGLRPGLRSYDFKVPKKTPRILVRCQKPTADNNYAWYNVYADGWVEQGGVVGNPNGQCILVTLPIGMMNTSFTAIVSGNTSGVATNYNGITCERRSATQIAICTTGQQGNGCSWRVEGYADASEYTKDKWDYQNVQVERPMVQLFNGATDDAVATCASVLQDVANLNMGDYVIYWDSADSSDHSHAKPGVSTPTNHGWYRVYKSGWCEQGITQSIPGGQTPGDADVMLFITMAAPNYFISLTQEGAEWAQMMELQYMSPTTTQFTARSRYGTSGSVRNFMWRVEGYAA